jgi:hypothetical protein
LPEFVATAGRVPMGEQVHGFIVPFATGNYTFAIRARQGIPSQLWLAPNSTRDAVQLIATSDWATQRPQLNWSLTASQQSGPVFLEQGIRYYVKTMAFVYSNYGPHRIDVAWRYANVSDANATRMVISDANIIPQAALRPWESNCSTLDSCRGCTTAANCAWCGNTCTERTSSAFCPAPVTATSKCPGCNDLTDCKTCLAQPHCEYINYFCREVSGNSLAVRKLEQCSRFDCDSYSDCGNCTSTFECGWCASTQRCFSFNAYLTRYSNGQCQSWHTVPGTCPACSSRSSCADCTAEFGCGWAYNTSRPSQGLCAAGEFGSKSPTLGLAGWAYDTCPADTECTLLNTTCSQNQTCVETDAPYPSGFTCVCGVGYELVGTQCLPVCNQTCVRGSCSSPGVCQCPAGWSGLSCQNCEYSGGDALPWTHGCGSNASCIPSSWNATVSSYNYSPADVNASKSCQCYDGYAGVADDGCKPFCSQGCVHGTCTAPDTCVCDLGFAGTNCTECDSTQSSYAW